MASSRSINLGLVLASVLPLATAQVSYSVPSSPPSNSSPQLNASPIGVSLEFFAFPGYFNNVQATQQCLQNLQELSGTWPPMRVGGTTQDRATYDPNSNQEVTYSVSSPGDAPSSLTFGPSFFDLANSYGGNTIIGLNRRLNNQSNTIAAANQALSVMNNLDAIELGNEPNFYSSSDPIADGSWGPSQDEASQNSWQASVGSAIDTTDIFSAGVYFGTGSYSIQNLVPKESSNSLSYVEYFCSHNYPQSGSGANLANLMSHSSINSQISQFQGEIAAANNAGKAHIMGETNSATQGGGGISPTYGAALWVMDYSLQMLVLGTKALYFHQGTIGNCQYCWWGRYDMGAPYYGAYFASLALANVTKIAPLDDGSTNYAAYALYDAAGTPTKVLLYNSDYYDANSGSRSSQTVTLSGLPGSSVQASRLTAQYATSRVDQGSNPSLGGLTFANGSCDVQGTSVYEQTSVDCGQASFTVAASEALLVYL